MTLLWLEQSAYEAVVGKVVSEARRLQRARDARTVRKCFISRGGLRSKGRAHAQNSLKATSPASNRPRDHTFRRRKPSIAPATKLTVGSGDADSTVEKLLSPLLVSTSSAHGTVSASAARPRSEVAVRCGGTVGDTGEASQPGAAAREATASGILNRPQSWPGVSGVIKGESSEGGAGSDAGHTAQNQA